MGQEMHLIFQFDFQTKVNWKPQSSATKLRGIQPLFWILEYSKLTTDVYVGDNYSGALDDAVHYS